MKKGNNVLRTVYQFKANNIQGNSVSMDKYNGQVLLIANVASLCGFTNDSYNMFKSLSDKYYDQGLRILLFPCNQFLNQEPGDSQQIEQKACKFGGKFDLFEKIDVNGKNAHPLFEFLKQECPGTLINAIKWNFTKFLVDRNGKPVHRFAPNDNNLDKIGTEIKNLLQNDAEKSSSNQFPCDEM